MRKLQLPFADSIAKRIRARREELELSRQQLAYKIKIGEQAIYKIETGRARPTLETLQKLAVGLDTTVSELTK